MVRVCDAGQWRIERCSFKESAAAKAEGVKKEPTLLIRRTGADGKDTMYQVTDTIAGFSPADWYADAPSRAAGPRRPCAWNHGRTLGPTRPLEVGAPPGRRDRVVAVIAQGQEWQFKGFPPAWSTPTEVFANGP